MLEARVIKAAESLLGYDKALVMEIQMRGKEVAGTEMICGGNVDVLVQGITPSNTQAREILDAVLRCLKKGGRGVLAVGPLAKVGQEIEISMLFYQSEGQVFGSIGDNDAVLDVIRSHAERVLGANIPQFINEGDQGQRVLLQPVLSQPTVIIFGAGHISVKLAPMLAMLDFRVVVVDDREEFANQKRFPQATQIIVSDYADSFDQLEFASETYCVIVTRGHLHDKAVLEKVANLNTRYVGMIGSRRKWRMMYEALISDGVSPEQLNRVYSPIGLDIGAETPEEIAISIAAELVQVRAKNSVFFEKRG